MEKVEDIAIIAAKRQGPLHRQEGSLVRPRAAIPGPMNAEYRRQGGVMIGRPNLRGMVALAATVACLSACIHATSEIGAVGGVNRTHASRGTVAGIRTGVLGVIPVRESDALAVQLDASYSQRGRRENLGFLIYDPELERDRREDYAELSVLARGNLFGPATGSRFGVQLLLGPTLSLPLRCHRMVPDTGERHTCSGSTVVSITLGAGLDFRVNEHLALMAGFRYGTQDFDLVVEEDASIAKFPDSSLLAGVTYRRAGRPRPQ